jgi:hypothetical protein
VLNSRINSWESWFIFNLQEKKQSVRTIKIRTTNNHGYQNQAWVIWCRQHMTSQFPFLFSISYVIYSIHTWAAIFLEHLANTSVMALSSDQTEPLASCFPHVSFLFVLAHPVSCCLAHCFMYHTCSLPCQPDSLTQVYKWTIWLCCISYRTDTHVYITFILLFILSFILLHFWAGRLAPIPLVGNNSLLCSSV